MQKKPFSNVDAAWLRMEQPDDPMMICGVLVFGTPMDFDRLKATIEGGLLRFARFRQHAVVPDTTLRRPYWEDDPAFDISNHLKRIQLAPPADKAVLREVASELASTQLDLSKPLWQFHLVENYATGSALICRLHHCIADGVALVQVLLSLTSADPDSPPWIEYMELPAPPAERAAPRFFPRARRLISASRRLAKGLGREVRKSLAERSHAAELARTALEGTKALAILVGRWPDPRTVFKGPLGVPKEAAWSEPMALDDIKAIGRALGGTVNDVMLSAVAGAMRRYLQENSQRVDGLNLRAVVPVNMRKPGTETELGNRFSLFFLSLPVGIGEPVERLRELKRRMDGLKGSLEAPVAFGILNAIGMSPQRIQDIVVNIFGTKGTAVMTNVMGPKVQIYLAGAPLEEIMFWVPQSGRLGMGVSILSYAGKVWLGVISDLGLVANPAKLVEAFQAEYEAMLDLAREVTARPSIAKMTQALDEALTGLDEVVAAKAVPPPSTARARGRPKRVASPEAEVAAEEESQSPAPA